MIEEAARVVDAEGEFAWVETQRRSSCGACAANKGCGTATLERVLGKRATVVKVINRVGARVGDQVVVGIHEDALVRGSLAVYALPLLALLGGGLLGEWLGRKLGLAPADGPAIVFAVVGFIAALQWLRRFGLRAGRDERYQPTVLRTVSPAVRVVKPMSRA